MMSKTAHLVKTTMQFGQDRFLVQIESPTQDHRKAFAFQFEQVEAMKAIYNPDTCMNTFTVSPKVLDDIFTLFPVKLEQVTLVCGSESFQSIRSVNILVQSFSQESSTTNRAMDTLVTVDLLDFIEYVVPHPVNITINLKELKKVLAYGDTVLCDVTCRFDGPGR